MIGFLKAVKQINFVDWLDVISFIICVFENFLKVGVHVIHLQKEYITGSKKQEGGMECHTS